jgi:hypothetical protein
VLLNAAKGLVDTARPIKGRPAGTSLKDLGFNQLRSAWTRGYSLPGARFPDLFVFV